MTQKWKEGQEGRGEGWRGYKNKVPSVSVVKTWPANDMAWTSGCHLQRMKLPLHGKQQRQQLRGKNKNKNNKTQPNFASLHFAIWYSNWPRRHSGMSDNKGLDEKVSSSQIPEGNVSWPAQKKKKKEKNLFPQEQAINIQQVHLNSLLHARRIPMLHSTRWVALQLQMER